MRLVFGPLYWSIQVVVAAVAAVVFFAQGEPLIGVVLVALTALSVVVLKQTRDKLG